MSSSAGPAPPPARISVLVIQSWLKLGGAEMLSVELASRLADRGHQVAIACTYLDSTFLDNDLANVRLIRPWRWVSQLCRRSRLAFLMIGCPVLFVLVLIHARDYDLINSHNFPAFWAAACASVIWRRPAVWHFNEPAPGPPAFLWVDRALIGTARAITVLDERSRARVRSLFDREPILVRAGVDFAFWSAADGDRHLATDELSNRVILLSVGKLHHQKNQPLLIRTLALLASEIPELTLVLIGDGPERQPLERLVGELSLEDRVVFMGMLDSGEVRTMYRRAFLLCFPAVDQTWGLTPFEALCQRTVSLVSSQTGAAEVLGPLEIGLVQDPNPADFAAAIRYAYRHQAHLREMAERGSTFVESTLSWDRFTDQVLEVFESQFPPQLAGEPKSSGSRDFPRGPGQGKGPVAA